MKDNVFLLFNQWLLFQEQAILCIEQRIIACIRLCAQEENKEDCNASRIEKNIHDICRKMQQIQQHQKCIESFISANKEKISPNLEEKCNSIRNSIIETYHQTMLLATLTQEKISKLRHRIHYSALFLSQI